MALDITSNLELHWFGTGSGSTLTDLSGGSVGDGTLSGNTSLVTNVSDHPNGLTAAVAHTGTGGDVLSSGNLTLDSDTDQTIAFWLKNIAAGTSYIVNTHDGTDYGLTLRMSSAENISMWPGLSGTAGDNWFVDALDDGNWHHLVLIYDASEDDGHFWLDGAFRVSDTSLAPGAGWATDNPVRLFERGGGDDTMQCQLCDVRIYSRALALGSGTDTDGNIAALYAYTGPATGGSFQQTLVPG